MTTAAYALLVRTVHCPACPALPGQPCRSRRTGRPMSDDFPGHIARGRLAKTVALETGQNLENRENEDSHGAGPKRAPEHRTRTRMGEDPKC